MKRTKIFTAAVFLLCLWFPVCLWFQLLRGVQTFPIDPQIGLTSDVNIFPNELLTAVPPFICKPRTRRISIDNVDETEARQNNNFNHYDLLNLLNDEGRGDEVQEEVAAVSVPDADEKAAEVSSIMEHVRYRFLGMLRPPGNSSFEPPQFVQESEKEKEGEEEKEGEKEKEGEGVKANEGVKEDEEVEEEVDDRLKFILNVVQHFMPEGMEGNATPPNTTPPNKKRVTLDGWLSHAVNFIRSSSAISCFVRTVILTRQSPRNIGTVLCGCVKHVPLGEPQCQIVSSLSTYLACNEQDTCPFSKPFPYIPTLQENNNANLTLVATLPTPKIIPEETIDAEMQTYYLAWKSIVILSTEAQQAACNYTLRPPSTVHGWQVIYNIIAVEGHSAPFARLSRRSGLFGSDFLISIRGTQTVSEWGIDFSYDHVPCNFLHHAPLHRGFSGLATFLWLAIKPALQELPAGSRPVGSITVTGHSLGGAVASVLALILAEQFPEPLPNGEPRIRLVVFGAPRAGDAAFVSELSKRVVTRAIMSEFDPVPYLPCDVSPGCPGKAVPIATATDHGTVFSFAQYHGVVNVPTKSLTPLFTTQKNPGLHIGSWHSCAYDCWTSLKADSKHLSSCLARSKDSKTPSHVVCYEDGEATF